MRLSIPIVQLHADCHERQFILVPFGRDPDLGVSVAVGSFLTFGWEEFERIGFEIVRKSLTDYHNAFKEPLSEFDRLSVEDRISFLKKRASFLISERGADLWWIDPMERVGDGSSVLPIGPRSRVKFQPSQEGSRFFAVLLQLMPPGSEPSSPKPSNEGL